MRVSLVTRVVAGYFLVFLLLGGVALYCVVTIERLQQETLLVRRGVATVSDRFSRLAYDVGHMRALLSKGRCEQILILSHLLPDFKPFEAMALIGDGVAGLADEPSLSPRGRELLLGVVSRLAAMVEGEGHFKRTVARARRAGVTVPEGGNAATYSALLERFIDAARTAPPEESDTKLAPVRRALLEATESLGKQVKSISAAYSFSMQEAWTESRAAGQTVVRIAGYMGMVSLAVVALVLFLLLSWLRPLGKLRNVAQRIANGDYDQPAEVRRADEVGELAAELNKTASRLKEREEKIRSQASELLRAERFSTIGKMATQIAHEVRNPLNALGLKLELLDDAVEEARGSLSPDAWQELKQAVAAGGREIDRLREITDYYLKFAKFPNVEKEHVELHTVLTDVATFYEEEARLAGVSLEHELVKPLRAHADPGLLRHAVANLLKNAIDAASGREGVEGRVVLRAWRETGQVRISVSDNGPGIPADQLGRVFEPFFTTKKSGTGLGLTLVQQVIDEHGGKVVCSSTPGEGTIFRIWFPE